MADTEKFNEELERIIELFRKLYEAGGKTSAEFKRHEETIRAQIASGKSLDEVFGKLTGSTKRYDSYLGRLTNTSDRYEKTVKSATIEYRVLNEQLRRGSVDHKEAFEAIQETTRSIKSLEKQLEALEIEAALTDPLDNASYALKQTEIEATRASLADLKKAEAALKVTASYRELQTKLIAGLALVPGIIGGAMKKGILDHAAIAADPLTAASSVLTAGISLAGKGVQGLVAMIPVIGTGLSKMAEAASQAAQTAVQFLTQELKATADSMKTLAAQGASFGGGLTEIRQIAVDSGMNLQMFTNVLKNSRESILAMGLSGGDAATQIASVSKAMKNQLGPSGKTVRDELLALGFSLEEQGEITAQYMAQLRASGQDLRNLAPNELVTGTREYAKNLKIISDITGQDAKKLMEKSRAESMRGALLNRLDKDQRESFNKAHSLLAKFGPEVQHALVQRISLGGITDARIAANQDIVRMIEDVAGNVQGANADIAESTVRAMGEARQRLESSSLSKAADDAAVAGVTGLVSDVSRIINNILSSGLSPEQAERTASSAEAQMRSMDGATAGFVKATTAAVDFSNELTELATPALEDFGTILGKTVDTMKSVLGMAFGRGTTVTGQPTAQSRSADAAAERLASARESGVSGGELATIEREANLENARANAAIIERRFGRRGTLPTQPLREMATGGITRGPSIAGEAGPEAVVPLPDGRSIPVSVDFSQMMRVNGEIRDILGMMLGKMGESINTQRRLLENSY